MIAEPPRTAAEYGGEFAGFLHAFTLAATGRPPMAPGALDPHGEVQASINRAAVAAWEDHLIRTRRSEAGARRKEMEVRP